MIETFYGRAALDMPQAFFAAFVIGLAFGFVLERAGFGSSRKLAAVFYLKDMTVLKVMFTAMITAMLGLFILLGLGVISPQQLYVMPTIYGAFAVGGIIFGIGFVMGGWCPGTAAVGAASGKWDAVIFLIGGVLGSILYNELYPLLKGLAEWGRQPESSMAFGLPVSGFAFVWTIVAVLAFYLAEWIEKMMTGQSRFLKSSFLKAFSLGVVIIAGSLFILPPPALMKASGQAAVDATDSTILADVAAGADHISPAQLANRLMAQEPMLVVDIRTAEEFKAFHIKGARNVAMADLPAFLDANNTDKPVVLYSTGMTHPAQARDSLAAAGYSNLYILTDGLKGFIDQCLTPVSLRSEELTTDQADRVRAWRAYFMAGETGASAGQGGSTTDAGPRLVDTDWLAQRLGEDNVKVIDVRTHAEYTLSHIPGSLSLQPESFRGMVGGVPSLVLPGSLLAGHLSLMGIESGDFVVLMAADKLRDATLIGMALDRVGHEKWAILDGGFAQWEAESRPLTTDLPDVQPTDYPAPASEDAFTVDYRDILAELNSETVVLDVRPPENFTGEKSSEARPGHIPGAINREYKTDLAENGYFKPTDELAGEYAKLIPAKETPVIVMCRTGHQASQTYFLLRYILGYENVRWYDASWTEWSARKELPVAR